MISSATAGAKHPGTHQLGKTRRPWSSREVPHVRTSIRLEFRTLGRGSRRPWRLRGAFRALRARRAVGSTDFERVISFFGIVMTPVERVMSAVMMIITVVDRVITGVTKVITGVMIVMTRLMKVMTPVMRIINAGMLVMSAVMMVITAVDRVITGVMKVITGVMRIPTELMKVSSGVMKFVAAVVTGLTASRMFLTGLVSVTLALRTVVSVFASLSAAVTSARRALLPMRTAVASVVSDCV
jgi:phage-related protein